MSKLFIALVGLASAIGALGGLIVYTMLSWGYVLYKFWEWFVLPVFHTLPSITMYQAVGLMFVVNLFKSHVPANTPDNETTTTKKVGNMIGACITPWVTLVIAYLFT